MTSIDHFQYPVTPAQFDTELSFLLASLSHFGVKELMRFGPHVVGMGKENPILWISAYTSDRKPIEGDRVTQVHVALGADNHADIDKFHAAALAAGAKDNGAPGLLTEYHPNYYGAFVISPAGHNVEVCCHLCPDELAAAAKAKTKSAE